jgi:hypothetical protein
MTNACDRSFAAITPADLSRLGRIARAEREEFFKRHPEWRMLYGGRMLCVALTGDAALHFTNGATGVAEFDVFTFYAANAEAPFPYTHVGREDFGKAKFGKLPGAPNSFVGRPVNLEGRDLDASPADDPVAALHAYLRHGKSGSSARAMRDSAVVLIEPEPLLGYVVWPTLALARE